IGIHECFSGNRQEEVEHKLSTLSLFNEGMFHYVNRSFENAKRAFGEVIESSPSDRTAEFFYAKSEQLINNKTAENWMGVVEMQEK
ncbi:MAG TPA: hypothetical protein VFS22_03470, partial [Flavisolibacter sp.]|nr:hypothetical protein [Flavisolibacter sp.]